MHLSQYVALIFKIQNYIFFFWEDFVRISKNHFTEMLLVLLFLEDSAKNVL